MRHQKNSKRLGRITSHRKAMFRNMATSLLDNSRIETTETKAKELRHYVERMITLGKRGDLHARRQALGFLRKRDVVGKVFGEYAERFRDRPGGYTRILKLGTRTGDNARMAIIEIIGTDDGKEKEKAVKGAEEKAKKEGKKEGKKEAKGKKEEIKKADGKKAGARKPEKKSPEARDKQRKPKAAEEEGEKGSKGTLKKGKKPAPKA